ncbi:hypothetical protein [Streptomyces noursei]|uniref:hypothetical protein n=1 Tax=Streptomyces noursei TaxID=1971 RepID=UPI001678995E|nr:hypothetical protein [Streptomyces noursei]MCZ1018933.1 hypothetical protein [Streptomyces noursei]
MLQQYDKAIAGFESSLREAQQKRAAVAALRDETHALDAGLRSAQEHARNLGLLQPSPPPVDGHLWVVPDGEDAASSDHEIHESRGESTPASPYASHDVPDHAANEPESAPPAPVNDAPAEVIVRGARMKEILNVVGSRPGDTWVSSEIADLLGIDRSNRSGRRALRANLHALAERGTLERISIDGDSRVHYKARMNWRFI